ncbi:MAG: SDR family oxidoreductase [Candidatus Dormibacteraeota bacterium]|uniref:SDR family oxidoreductase n=1 Tax=Candidatus Nephthysia bennettiae TaxID=3127016 RepID=A0A934K3M4_9BACT|nr:SDR family oxidoreductase [Candidatus Dormibacteraeota bacterium]MBJ7614190.1 SDR family oxidoreductase [Candidatus Dormibacteraeota bacterium]
MSAVPDFSLSGRVAIVTGASRGLGVAIAEGLAEQGSRVVLSSRKQEDLDREAERLNARFAEGTAMAVAAHAGREADLRRLVEATMERFGRVDILVNNAGTNPYFGPLIDAQPAIWDKTFEVNLRGYFLLSQLVYRAWMEVNGGVIVNVASTGGLRPSFGLGVYDITKAGVIMLTRQLARELGGKVRVNCIAPGLFKTRFAEALWGNETILNRVLTSNPMGRIGDPPEIAGAVVFLASDAASYVNGEVLVVDGGG